MWKTITAALAGIRTRRPSGSRRATSRGVRLGVEALEGRAVPANLTVTYAAATHTLTVAGDNAANDLTVQGDISDPTHFVLTSAGTINNGPGTFATPSGVENMAIRLLAGDDRLTFAINPAVHLRGGLTIDGGDGSNTIYANYLTVGKGLAIRNGVGYDMTLLSDPSVGGSLTIRNGDGGSWVNLDRGSQGVSTIGGSVRITNGTGSDVT